MPINLSFDGIIGEAPNDAATVRAALRAGGPVQVNINSYGGVATEGLAIYNLLKAHSARVDVTVDAVAASAASLIAMAGDRIEMRAGSLLMIHDPSAVAIGPASVMEQTRAVLEKMANEYASIYAQRSGKTVERVREMMIAESWLTGPEAVDAGLADAASSKAAAAYAAPFDNDNKFHFFNMPASIAALASKVPPMTTPNPSPENPATPTPAAMAADVTADILARAAKAGFSAAQASEIVAKANGNIDVARDLILETALASLPGRTDPYVPAHVGLSAGGDPQGHATALGDALLSKLKGIAPTGAGKPFGGMSIVGLAAEWLRANGITQAGHDATTIVRQAMGARSFLMKGAYSTTSDFPNILGDSMNRSLANLFTAADNGISQVAGKSTLPDFRTMSIGKLSSFPDLKEVLEGGEIEFGALEDAGEKVSVATYARAINVTLQVLVNDNLGAVERSLRDIAFGAANLKAKLLLNALLTATMSDGKTLFHADHGNIVDTTAPKVASIDAVRQAMRQQKALDNETVLGLGPRYLLVPSTLETVTEVLTTSIISPASVDQANPFQAKLIAAAEPRLDAIDNAAWFAFADPAVMPAITFATLEGTPIPRLEIQDPADFNRLGTAYRAWWGAGAAPVEYRAAVKATGTATS